MLTTCGFLSYLNVFVLQAVDFNGDRTVEGFSKFLDSGCDKSIGGGVADEVSAWYTQFNKFDHELLYQLDPELYVLKVCFVIRRQLSVLYCHSLH